MFDEPAAATPAKVGVPKLKILVEVVFTIPSANDKVPDMVKGTFKVTPPVVCTKSDAVFAVALAAIKLFENTPEPPILCATLFVVRIPSRYFANNIVEVFA